MGGVSGYGELRLTHKNCPGSQGQCCEQRCPYGQTVLGSLTQQCEIALYSYVNQIYNINLE